MENFFATNAIKREWKTEALADHSAEAEEVSEAADKTDSDNQLKNPGFPGFFIINLNIQISISNKILSLNFKNFGLPACRQAGSFVWHWDLDLEFF